MVPMVVMPRSGHFRGEGGALLSLRKPNTWPVLGRSAGYIHSRRYMIASRAVGGASGRLPSLERPDKTLEARLNPLFRGFSSSQRLRKLKKVLRFSFPAHSAGFFSMQPQTARILQLFLAAEPFGRKHAGLHIAKSPSFRHVNTAKTGSIGYDMHVIAQKPRNFRGCALLYSQKRLKYV